MALVGRMDQLGSKGGSHAHEGLHVRLAKFKMTGEPAMHAASSTHRHLHVIGICGTFMGSLALLARELGYRVTGSDANVYPPMSTQLEASGIVLQEGYQASNLSESIDCVIVGNALSRGNPEIEALLNLGIPYCSGPQWLGSEVLKGRDVIAVAGTHGKTTTASMLAWLLECGGLAPGFLIGGVPRNFGVSARLGDRQAPFVIEADEYDTAFFDKRSKFVHYRPSLLVLNNLEFDHADIFADLGAIETQFHHLIRTVPGRGQVLAADHQDALDRVLARGIWTPVMRFGTAASSDWRFELEHADASRFRVIERRQDSINGVQQEQDGVVEWTLSGEHNARNGLAALAAAACCGSNLASGCAALSRFESPRRRQEVRGEVNRIQVIDDFAHHPTAIAATLGGLRAATPGGRLLAVIELGSNSMRMGAFEDRLTECVRQADHAYWYCQGAADKATQERLSVDDGASLWMDTEALVKAVVADARPLDRIVVMSNGSFNNIHVRLLDGLARLDACSPHDTLSHEVAR